MFISYINNKYPFIYLLAALIAGILCSEYLHLPFIFFYGLILIALLSFKRVKIITELCFLVCIFYIGSILPEQASDQYQANKTYLLSLRCDEKLSGNNYVLSDGNNKFFLSSFQAQGSFIEGDSLFMSTRIRKCFDHANPYEFSYTRYLAHQEIFHQLYPTDSIQKIGHSHNLLSWFLQFRSQLMEKNRRLSNDSTCLSLINALCLGYQNDIGDQLENLFITTGTIHLLSVSGLHTGIIFLLFMSIFKILRLTKPKSQLLIIPLLWSYACLTGLSPSVVRAATILSFITIGKAFCRSHVAANTLALSAFLTLLFSPKSIYSLSFLLSYSAYAGILLIYPYLYHLPGRLPRVISWMYASCCITIAAQLPTLPISAYYFHSININGFIANLVAVPLSSIILYLATFCLFLPEVISQHLMVLCELTCKLLTGFLEWFSPYSFNISDLYPSGITTILIYLAIGFAGFYIIHPKRHYLYGSIITLVLLLGYTTISRLTNLQTKEIIIYHYPGQTAILLNYCGNYLYLKNTTDTTEKTHAYIRRNHLQSFPYAKEFISRNICKHSGYIQIDHSCFLIPDSKTEYIPDGSTLIITGNFSPETIESQISSQHLPQQIILDGSNNYRNRLAWKAFCCKYNISYQSTHDSGAISLGL